MLTILDLNIWREGVKLKSYIGRIRKKHATYLEENYEHFMTGEALAYYKTLIVNKRKQEWLCGQYLLKSLVVAHTGNEDYSSFDICKGVFNQPFILSQQYEVPFVSLTHSDEDVIGVSCPLGHPIGIDLEKIKEDSYHTIKRQLTEWELQEVKNNFDHKEAGAIQFWSLKEAVSKATLCGMMIPFQLLELDQITYQKNSRIECRYRNFLQYRAYSQIIGNEAISLAIPFKSETNFDFLDLFSENTPKYKI